MNINNKADVAVAATVILAALGTYWRWLRPRLRSVRRDGRAIRDTLLGREEIRDSITNEVKVPALPGVGQRVASLEQAIGPLSVALARLADTHERLEAHDQRLNALEKAERERTLARTEAIEMFRAMDTAMKTQPDDN